MKTEMMNDLLRFTNELNTLEDKIYSLTTAILVLQNEYDTKEREVKKKVLEMSTSEEFKKDLSNAEKRQFKIDEMMQEFTKLKEVIVRETQNKNDLEHEHTKLHRSLSTLKIVCQMMVRE